MRIEDSVEDLVRILGVKPLFIRKVQESLVRCESRKVSREPLPKDRCVNLASFFLFSYIRFVSIHIYYSNTVQSITTGTSPVVFLALHT